jgi:uncharacterized protein YndB with AHSA1/START domain
MTDAAAPAPKKRGILKKIGLGLLAAIVVFLIVVACQPADYHIVRTTQISAPVSAVFAQVNDFHQWEAWNPWGQLDPAMKQTYEGASSGTGAVYSWAGNDQAGEGRMTLTESKPNELIRVKLEFMKPMQGTSDVQFLFKPEGDQTSISWDMTGRKNFISKGVCMYMDMDKMVGGEFEKGLAQIKAIVEKK